MEITDPQLIEKYYTALLRKDLDYIGVFYVGVTSTSIFCLPTCYARKPKRENVVFYTTVKDVLDHGFRPCKLCRPTENAYEKPEYVEKALELVNQNPKKKIKDQTLRENEISPEKLRRWFKKHYGLTFHAYQRMYRVNHAYIELQKGGSAADVAYESGYESLSGFGYTYKKLMGVSPKDDEVNDVILINRVTTPLGPMFVCSTKKGICLLEFSNRKMLETEFMDLQKRLNAPILMGENEHILQLKKELTEYFEGERREFDVALDPVGTDFQKQVWEVLMDIPYGTTTTYMAQATMMDKKSAIRAVASANGYNKMSIIIPCHRVIGSNGKLTGYGGGLDRKRWLLNHEASQDDFKLSN